MSERSGWRRPDESMSLLADLFGDKALDPGYAAATRRRPGRFGVLAVLLVVGLLLAMAGEQARRSEPAAQQRRTQLIEWIEERSADADALKERARGLGAEVEVLRRASLTRSDAGRRTASRLDHAGNLAAFSPLTGHALKVTLNDSDSGKEEGKVLDQDLQAVVNGLWASGARGISVGGQRLTPTTAIRTAGQAVLVDYRPLSPPYEVLAVGAQENEFEKQAIWSQLKQLQDKYGIRYELSEEDRVTLAAAAAPHRLRYARETE